MSLLPPKVHVPATPAIEGIDIRSLYDVDHATLLGKGGFSEVLACRHIPTGELRALKVMQREILVGKKGEMVAHEKEILRRTCHPNIVTLYETIQNTDKVYFALDLMNEDLFEFIVRNKKINETLTRKIVFAILSAVNYLHEQSIVHRDIKPENILINVRYTGPMPGCGAESDDSRSESDDQDGDETQAARASRREAECRSKAAPPTNVFENVNNINDIDPTYLEADVKLADFGLAKLVVEWDVKSTPCGTSFYIAPEVIRGIEEQGARPLVTTQRLVKSVDVWSAGVVFFVLLSGRPPFHGQVKTGEERRALLKKIDHGVLFNPNHGWDAVSMEARDLIARMLEQDSSKRITAAECLRHPFFTKHGFTQPTPGGDPMKVLRQQQQLALQRQKLREMQEKQEQQTSPQDAAANMSFMNAEEQNGTFIVGEGSASVRAQIQQQQQQQQLGSGSRSRKSGTSPTSANPHSSERSSKSKKGNNLFANMKYFFTGGHHDKGGSNGNGGSSTVAATAKEREEQQQMHAELEALQQDVIAAEDKEGETTAYKPTAPMLREQKPARPAMMNPHAKVGPAALKK